MKSMNKTALPNRLKRSQDRHTTMVANLVASAVATLALQLPSVLHLTIRLKSYKIALYFLIAW